jgi:LysR family nitrogen assimilation transcriptional regulator
MQLERLRVVHLVGKLGSISKAALALQLAQSAVSRHIALQEAEWGDRLFERTGRGVSLTEFGARMLPLIRGLLNHGQRLAEQAHEASGVASGNVHIGVLPSLSNLLIARLMEVVRAEHPAIQLRVRLGFSGVLDEHLAAGNLDFAIINRYSRTAPSGEDSLGKLDTYVIGRRGHAMLGAQEFPFAQLGRLVLALPGEPNGVRLVLDSMARERQITLNVGVEVDAMSAIKEVVMQSDVCSLVSYTAIHEEARLGQLVAVKLIHPGLPRTVSLAITRAHPMSLAARVVLREVKRLVPAVIRQFGSP